MGVVDVGGGIGRYCIEPGIEGGRIVGNCVVSSADCCCGLGMAAAVMEDSPSEGQVGESGVGQRLTVNVDVPGNPVATETPFN